MENEIKEKLYISEKDYILDSSKNNSITYTNYIMELDEKGKPIAKDDEMFVLPKYSHLLIKLLNNNNTVTMTYFQEITHETKLERHEESCAVYFTTKLSTPGPYRFVLSNAEGNLSEFYIIVEPKPYINDREVHLDGLQIQTVLSKSLGKISQWENHYKECEYLSKLTI
jgi:hypothetical protein